MPSLREKKLNLITLQQTRFQAMSENIISKNILKSFLLLIYFLYVFKIFDTQSNWHSNFILASRNTKIINSVTAAFTIVCQFVIVCDNSAKVKSSEVWELQKED